MTDGALEHVVPGTSVPGGLTKYWCHLTRLYENGGENAPIVHFGNLALASTERQDPAVRDMWTKVFLANTTLRAYDAAYVTLTSTPYPDMYVSLAYLTRDLR